MPDRPASNVIPLPDLHRRLPTPDAALDAVLDATIQCVTRYGLAKTSLSDIAREMGVAPSTVYRKVGTVEHAAYLAMSREGHRLIERMPDLIAEVEGARKITVFLAEAIETTRRHPMAAKIVSDETDWMGKLATRRLESLLADAASMTAPGLAAAMDAGLVRRQDPDALAHWIVRIGMVCVASPPPGDLLEALDALLLPVLEDSSAAEPKATSTAKSTAPARATRRARTSTTANPA